MEGDSKNSDKDVSLLPSDCEEISVNPLSSSLDTVSFQERKHRHYKSKYEHRRRKNRGNSIPNDKHKKHCRHRRNRCEQKQKSSDQQTITQKIHVQKANFKCIINLNTTVCDHDHRNSINVEKSQCSKNQLRPIPQCRKPLCRSSRPYQTKLHTHSKESCKRPSFKTASGKEMKKQYDNSPSRLNQDDDDHISNTIFEKSDIPRSYKNAVKHSKKYESKLDTLIRRTKERERKLVEQSRNYNIASSPYTDISSGELPSYSEYAASLHSQSTLILDPQPCEIAYSPSIDSFYPIKTVKYSPTSFNKYLDSDFEMKVKPELIMDIGAYSPTQQPITMYFSEEWIKNDIKREPKEEKFTVEFNKEI